MSVLLRRGRLPRCPKGWCRKTPPAMPPPAARRLVWGRFAGAGPPASLPEGLVREAPACHAPDGRAILLRCHRPAHRTPCGTVLFFHGGGFVVGSLDSHALI